MFIVPSPFLLWLHPHRNICDMDFQTNIVNSYLTSFHLLVDTRVQPCIQHQKSRESETMTFNEVVAMFCNAQKVGNLRSGFPKKDSHTTSQYKQGQDSIYKVQGFILRTEFRNPYHRCYGKNVTREEIRIVPQ